MSARGRYFDGRTSASQEVEVSFIADGSLQIAGMNVHRRATLRELKISERIGNTPRRIQFNDGALCELTDNDAVDQWLTQVRGHSLEHGVSLLERSWELAIGALVVTAIVIWLGIRYGVPALASRAAEVIPTSVDVALGRQSLEILDSAFLGPSKLPAEKQAEIRADFERIVAEAPRDHEYRLEFRAGKRIGANALALPSGIVVITDELVELAQDHNEIVAVLAHEVGHVVHRHALRTLVQSSASAALMVGVLGDFTSISTVLGAAPTVLLQAKFSRGFETEADDFSYDWLRRHNIPTHYFGDLLKRLEEKHGGGKADSFSYFSSHPRTTERVHD